MSARLVVDREAWVVQRHQETRAQDTAEVEKRTW